jgi:hypothetical protein
VSAAGAVLGLAKSLGLSRQLLVLGSRWAMNPRRMKRLFGDYAATERDVFVCSYARSGTNWMLQMALQTAHRGAAEFDHLHDLVPWPGTPSPGPIDLNDPRGWQDSPTGLRVIKTHAPAAAVPWSDDATYLVVLRDPREVVVSAYHFAVPLMGLADTVSPQDWLDFVITEAASQGSGWLDHAAGWWALRDRPNVHVFRYQDMKADLAATVARIEAALGVDLSEGERAAVTERGTVQWMKAHASRFTPIELPITVASHAPEMVRKGQAGANELYSPAEFDRLDRSLQDALDRSGSDLPLWELFPR